MSDEPVVEVQSSEQQRDELIESLVDALTAPVERAISSMAGDGPGSEDTAREMRIRLAAQILQRRTGMTAEEAKEVVGHAAA